MRSASTQALFDALASAGKALGRCPRAELIDVPAQGERHVDDPAVAIDQSVANTSHHLQQLLPAGLVRTRRKRPRVRLALLPADVTVGAYCRGPFCVTSDDAVRTRKAAGRGALRRMDGFPEGAAAGLPAGRGSG